MTLSFKWTHYRANLVRFLFGFDNRSVRMSSGNLSSFSKENKKEKKTRVTKFIMVEAIKYG